VVFIGLGVVPAVIAAALTYKYVKTAG